MIGNRYEKEEEPNMQTIEYQWYKTLVKAYKPSGECLYRQKLAGGLCQ
jgi:hypothetical protein